MTADQGVAKTGKPALPRAKRLAALALAVLTLAGCTSEQASDPEVLALRHFTLIDGTGGEPLRDAAMIIEDGRVTWTGPDANAQPSADAQNVDLTGKYVMPGIVDLHVHIGAVRDLVQDEANYTLENVTRDLATYASYGVTTVLSMGTDKDLIFPLRAKQRAGRPTVARVYTAGQGIVFKGGYGGVPGINHPVSTPEEAVAEVDRQAAKGVDVIKLWLDDEFGTMPEMPPEMSQAVIDAAHRHNLRALAHVFHLADAKRLVSQGIDGFVHIVRDKPVDQELIDAMREKGVTQVAATLSREAATHAFAADNPITQDSFFRQSLSPKALAELESPERERSVANSPHFSRLPRVETLAMQNIMALKKGGVRIGFGTDAGPPGRFPGYSEHWELAQMVKAGFTPAEAIHSATGVAADWLGAKDLGTLQPGKWADFIVLDADPVADIMNTRTISAVYIAGRPVPAVKQ